MSRRFGRKQRRAAREQIEALTDSLENTQSSLLNHRCAIRTLQDQNDALMYSIQYWDAEIRHLLGPYTSFAINDRTYRVDHPDQIRQMPIVPPTTIPMAMSLMPEQVSYYIETMLGFIAGLEREDLMRLRRIVTLRVQVGSDRPLAQTYCALSEQTWHQMKQDGPDSPGLQRLINRIAGDLVRLLAAPPKPKSAAVRRE